MTQGLHASSEASQPSEISFGNLSVQAGKLEEAGYVAISKSFEGKIPLTRYRLTDLGRERLAAYWQEMDEIRATVRAGG